MELSKKSKSTYSLNKLRSMTFSHAVFFCNDITSSTNVQNVPINEVANIVLISAIFKVSSLLHDFWISGDCAIWIEEIFLFRTYDYTGICKNKFIPFVSIGFHHDFQRE